MPHQVLNESDISSRFNYLLNERAFRNLYPAELVEQAAIDVAENGYIPSGDFLGKMGFLSNASTSWLLEGTGAPFPATYFEDDDEAAIHLDELLAEHGTVYQIITANSEWCLAFAIPTWLFVDGTWEKHNSISVMTGNLGPLTIERLEEAKETHQVIQREVTNERFELLETGWLGL